MAFGRGKVILLGEHSVVYGRPALAAGINRGVTAQGKPAQGNLLRIEPWGVDIAPTHADAPAPVDRDGEKHTDRTDLERAFRVALDSLPLSMTEGTRVNATVNLPTAAGLGASAALGVAVIGALHERFDLHLDPGELSAKAYRWEQVFHGNASGVDNHMAAHGGFARFQKDAPLKPLTLDAPLRLIVAQSGEVGCTRTMVESVARQTEQQPDKLHKIFDGIAAIVERGVRALVAGETEPLGQLMMLNQSLLSAMMVSTARIEELCRVAVDAGALGAKLTGAGGGGCLIALCPAAQEDAIENALGAAGGKPFWVQIESVGHG